MGTLYKYTCCQCHYSANISGGEDLGFEIYTQTGFCTSCQTLVDYVTALRPGSSLDPEKTDVGVCKNCNSEITLNWNEGDGCPLCGGEMCDRTFIMDWD